MDALRISVLALLFAVAMATGTTHVSGQSQQAPKPTGEPDRDRFKKLDLILSSPVVTTQQDLKKAAEKLGYTWDIKPGDYGTVDVKLQKEKKLAPVGPLGVRWGERETIGLTFLPSTDGQNLNIVWSKRTVEEKAPIGPWRTVTETDKLPSDLTNQFREASVPAQSKDTVN